MLSSSAAYFYSLVLLITALATADSTLTDDDIDRALDAFARTRETLGL